MLPEIEERIEATKKALKSINYAVKEVSAQEFCDYMTGEIFSEDSTTIDDVLGSDYLMVHELAEINELRRMGRAIDKRVIVDSPKTVIYDAHLTAMETELNYALNKKDYFWVKIRLRHHKESVLDDDPNLPEEMRPRAEALYERFRKAAHHKAGD
jgi:DNA-binding transcriptional regulator PaaX